jgi:hypothetical protein
MLHRTCTMPPADATCTRGAACVLGGLRRGEMEQHRYARSMPTCALRAFHDGQRGQHLATGPGTSHSMAARGSCLRGHWRRACTMVRTCRFCSDFWWNSIGPQVRSIREVVTPAFNISVRVWTSWIAGPMVAATLVPGEHHRCKCKWIPTETMRESARHAGRHACMQRGRGCVPMCTDGSSAAPLRNVMQLT